MKLNERLAVCSWSLQPADPAALIQHLQTIGITRVQLALDPLRENPAVWGNTAALFRQHGITIISGMFGTVGEDYTTLETIKKTGGVVPDEHWEQNWKIVQDTVEIAASLGLKLVTFHAGFLPHDESDPAFTKLFERIVRIADLFAARGMELGMETGQETADTLRIFLQKLNRPNVGVNFDPANMILYGKGNPIEALRVLGPWLKQCHIKDAISSRTPGNWGEEVPSGTGEVDWKAFFRTLGELNYAGNLSIEREAGRQRAVDILAAKVMVERIAGGCCSGGALRTINVGVIGLGFMGVTHIKAYRKLEGVRLAAICDAIKLPENGVLGGVSGNVADPDAVQLDMAQVKATKNYEDLLHDPAIDLIDICVPTAEHAKVAIAALQAGKHVVCEKPLARTSAIAGEIVAAAAQAKGYFIPAMCMRFWPGWSWLKEAIQDQRYGKVLAARFRRVSGPPGWSRSTYFKGGESGGALLDLHIHDTDFVQFLFGKPSRVSTVGITKFSGAPDHVVTQYEVAGGAVVTAEGSWLMSEGFGFNMAYTVNFEKATADFDLARGAEALKIFEDGQGARVEKCAEGDGYTGELGHMIDCIRAGRAPSIVTGQDGVNAVAICEAEERSARSGQWEAV